ncbi:uncharacterized protein B0J16DRAFT_375188 [Fusarium flagelliforme]|uniref:uncharacterized protein n=1 Tax=Fusarium flagelliforme TaxID=2675880 RepID=UPI001E8D762D|nr:uncharacterized protein B0J16DRAFT_375188 [Fusarium flagelliforme]KAH7174311.1 hypothetical protein B0J16DRAFT_375188 [Fusarium flagelliforme]
MSETVPTRVQMRSSLACLQCRSKHVKCDAKQPHCTRCLASQKECQYTVSRRGGLDRAALAEKKRHARKSNSRQENERSQSFTDATISPLDVEFMDCADIVQPEEDMSQETVASSTIEPLSTLADDPLIISYYKNFHVLHPFVLPLHRLVKICETPSSSCSFIAITPVMRLIGKLYENNEWSSPLQTEIESRISELPPSDPMQVQCRLLYSIALFWSSNTTKAKEEIDTATSVAVELGMHKREFVDAYGGDVVLMESWRRTWWMLYTVDAYYAGTLGTMNLKAFHVEATVDLPCEEDGYESSVIPEPHTVEDFESREFADEDIQFSSFAYLIGAVRAAALAISVTPKRATRQDSERMIQSADSVIDAWLLLLPKSKKVMRDDGSIDELMFQAQLLVHVATIGMHRPLSDLRFNPIENVSSCARQAPTETPKADLINVHTKRVLKSIDAQIQLLALPVRPFHHTPFTTCMVSEGTLSLLSACKYLLRDKELAIARDQIRLTIGCLKALGEVWARTAKNVKEIQTIARHVLGLEKASVSRSSEVLSLTGSSGEGSSQSADVSTDGDILASLGSFEDICGWINIGSDLSYDWMGEEGIS